MRTGEGNGGRLTTEASPPRMSGPEAGWPRSDWGEAKGTEQASWQHSPGLWARLGAGGQTGPREQGVGVRSGRPGVWSLVAAKVQRARSLAGRLEGGVGNA